MSIFRIDNGHPFFGKAFLFSLKAIISVLSLFFVFRAVDFHGVLSVFAHVNYFIFLLALFVFWAFEIGVPSLRCVYIVQCLGGALSVWVSIKARIVGLWFNQVLPSSIGGDAMKIVLLRDSIGSNLAIRASILDRVSGFFILLLSVFIMMPLYVYFFPADKRPLIYILETMSVGMIFMIIVPAWASHKAKKYFNSSSLVWKIMSLVSDVWLFRKGRPLWRQFWTSAITHVNGILIYILLALALGIKVNILIFALIVPLIFLVALIPVSFAGWGVREVGAVWLFGLVGFSKESALTLSIAYGLMLIVAGTPGLVLFMRRKKTM